MTERTPIPEDLMKVAREVADDHDAKMKALYGPTASTRRSYMIEMVAVALAAERERATLAERERCAAIARAAGDTWSGTRDATQACQEAAVDDKCEEIAAAILARP